MCSTQEPAPLNARAGIEEAPILMSADALEALAGVVVLWRAINFGCVLIYGQNKLLRKKWESGVLYAKHRCYVWAEKWVKVIGSSQAPSRWVLNQVSMF